MTDPRPSPPYAGDERATLVGFLERHRATMLMKVEGLDAGQLARTHPPSTLTLGGMVKHLAYVENWWFQVNFAGGETEPWASVDWSADEDWDWNSAADDGPAVVRELYDAEVARAREIVAATADLGQLGARRHPGTGEGLSLRWILVHMIEEYARHNGHADLIRESIDGATGQ